MLTKIHHNCDLDLSEVVGIQNYTENVNSAGGVPRVFSSYGLRIFLKGGAIVSLRISDSWKDFSEFKGNFMKLLASHQK